MPIALLPVQVGEVWFAIEAAIVVEILGTRPWVPIPDAPALTPGVLPWRGRAVAALDLGAMTQACDRLSTSGDARRRIVVVQIGDSSLAIPVDAVREVREVMRDQIKPAQTSSRPYAETEADLHGVLMPILDLASAVGARTASGTDGQASSA
jgi:chemotaxis signal transduction protein